MASSASVLPTLAPDAAAFLQAGAAAAAAAVSTTSADASSLSTSRIIPPPSAAGQRKSWCVDMFNARASASTSAAHATRVCMAGRIGNMYGSGVFFVPDFLDGADLEELRAIASTANKRGLLRGDTLRLESAVDGDVLQSTRARLGALVDVRDARQVSDLQLVRVRRADEWRMSGELIPTEGAVMAILFLNAIEGDSVPKIAVTTGTTTVYIKPQTGSLLLLRTTRDTLVLLPDCTTSSTSRYMLFCTMWEGVLNNEGKGVAIAPTQSSISNPGVRDGVERVSASTSDARTQRAADIGEEGNETSSSAPSAPSSSAAAAADASERSEELLHGDVDAVELQRSKEETKASLISGEQQELDDLQERLVSEARWKWRASFAWSFVKGATFAGVFTAIGFVCALVTLHPGDGLIIPMLNDPGLLWT